MDCQKIGNLIFKYRKEKNMTQKDLADLLNISDRTISKWERGLGCPDITLLIPLSKVLDISLYELLGGEEMNKKEKIKAEKVIENTINISTKKIKMQNTIDIILIIISSIIIIGICGFWIFVKYNYAFLYPPENVKVSKLIELDEYLKSNSCELTLDNPVCDGIDGTYRHISDLDFRIGMPMWRVKNGAHTWADHDDVNHMVINIGVGDYNEKDINKYRWDKNYTKKSMVINSLVLFTFIKNIESITFNFNDSSYIIKKDEIENLFSNEYVKIDDLLKDNNWKKYVIKNLRNKIFLTEFFNYYY